MSTTPALPASAAAAVDTPPASWRGWVVIVVAALIVPVGYLGNEGVSPLVALGGLLTLPFLLSRWRRPSMGLLILAALTGWAIASFAWSPLRVGQLSRLRGYNAIQALIAPKLAFQLLFYTAFLESARRLPPSLQRRALWVMTVAVSGTVALLLVEGAEGGAIYARLSDLVGQHWPPDLDRRNAARGCYGAVVLAWPAAAVLWRRDLAGGAVAILAVGAVGSLLLGVDAPVAALIAGLAAFVAVRRFGRTGVWVCLAVVALYFIATPALFLSGAASGQELPADIGKLSWHARLDIWRFASRLIAQRPLFGWGLDSSRAWPDQIPMHPHDAAIQIWLETGLVGVVLTTLFWVWLFSRIAQVEREDRTVAAVMAATAAAYIVIGAISFGVWQEWWLAFGAFALAACAMLSAARRAEAQVWGDAELVEIGASAPLAPQPIIAAKANVSDTERPVAV